MANVTKLNIGGTDYNIKDATARDSLGSTPLTTTAQTVTGALVEHESDIAALNGAVAAAIGNHTADNLTKVSKPTTNPNGTNGQVLKTNGDGTTEWVSVGAPTDQQTSDALSAYLTAHPEAVTTVQDGSVTSAKLAAAEKKLLDQNRFVSGGTIMPVYLGDYICPAAELPSCCVKVGNYIYCINSYNDTTDKGSLRVFSLTNNVEINSFPAEVLCGHANSIAYNPDTAEFFISPVFYRESGEAVATSDIIVYNSTFTEYRTISVDTEVGKIMGVSYDWVTGELYCCDYYSIYKYDGTDFDAYSTLAFPDEYDQTYFNQDFAIYNNNVYISSPYGMIAYGVLASTTTTLIGSMSVANTDTDMRFYMDELEGMEFCEDGRLYALKYVNIDAMRMNAFVVEIPVGYTTPKPTAGSSFGEQNSSVYITSESLNSFYNDERHIRSAAQIRIMQPKPFRVVVQTDVNDDFLKIDNTIQIEIAEDVTYTVKRLAVLSCDVSIITNTNAVFEFAGMSNPFVLLNRAGSITFGGSTCNVKIPDNETGNNFVSVDYSKTRTYVGNLNCVSGQDLKIVSTAIATNSIYFGTQKMQNERLMETGTVGVTIPAGSLYADVEVTYTKNFPSAPYLFARVFTTSTNINNVGIPVVMSSSRTGGTFRVWRNDTNTTNSAAPSITWCAMQI